MIRSYVERGLLAGAAGGLAFGLFVAVVGNPLVGYVEELGHAGEEGHHGGAAAGEAAHHAGEGLISGAVTNVVSVGGGILWGLLLGAAFFGVVYYFFEPAIPGEGASKRYVLAAAGFLTVSGAPWLVLPPQPAGIEATLSTETRILWYGGMILAGAAVCVLVGYTYRRLSLRGTSRPVATLAAFAPLALLALPVAVAPSTGVTGEVTAEMALAYRGFVIFGQATLWFVLASVHAWLGVPSSVAASEADYEFEGSAESAD
jgi:Probable cobalt transporter subunit (CbtA).